MALKISQNKAAFRCPVTISEPVDNGYIDQKISVQFKIIPQSRINQVVKGELDESEDIMDEVLVGWDDQAFRDDSDMPIPYNAETKKIVLDVPYVRTALTKAYFQAINGKDYARKN